MAAGNMFDHAISPPLSSSGNDPHSMHSPMYAVNNSNHSPEQRIMSEYEGRGNQQVRGIAEESYYGGYELDPAHYSSGDVLNNQRHHFGNSSHERFVDGSPGIFYHRPLNMDDYNSQKPTGGAVGINSKTDHLGKETYISLTCRNILPTVKYANTLNTLKMHTFYTTEGNKLDIILIM